VSPRTSSPLHRQRGVTLIVGLIMLVLITLSAVTAFSLAKTNLKAVGNMQFRNESIAAANKSIEDYVVAYFSTAYQATGKALPTSTTSYDANNDGTADYSVQLAAPICIESRAINLPSTPGKGISVTTPVFESAPIHSMLWEVDANVTDAVSGATVRIRQGIRLESATPCPIATP
jgi:Tfp pilus assembly protein PilX